jgi:hypothetical protein
MCEAPPARRETPVSDDVAHRRGRPLAKRAAGGRALPERSRPGQSPRQRRQLHRLVGVQQLAAERGGGHGGGTPRAEPDGATIPSLPQEDHRRGRGSTGIAPARRWCVPTPSACGFAWRWACGPTPGCQLRRWRPSRASRVWAQRDAGNVRMADPPGGGIVALLRAGRAC